LFTLLAEALPQRESSMTTPYSSPGGRHALIIEDDFLIALDLEENLSALGFDACCLAPSAKRARALAMIDQPDVVLIDVCLEGGREGIEVARCLRTVCDVPIVFVTAYNDKDTLECIYKQVPGAPVLSKPVYPKRLADAVAAVTKQ
jgi:CheY-like chemotaxis protein